MQIPQRVIWTPNSPQQRRFLESAAFEAMYGGAAGGGKSSALLSGLLRYAHERDFNGILFRRKYDELEQYIVPRAERMYPLAFPGADYNRSKHLWVFPSGARIRFSHMQFDEDALAHKSSEYQQVAFDELTSFSRFQYTYMVSRMRTTNPKIPLLLRSGTNPGDEGHDWVFERFAPWLNPDAKANGLPRAKSGQPLWFRNVKGKGEEYVSKGTPSSFARLFVQSFAKDNPALAVNDPSYVDRLLMLDPVQQAQLIEGDWTVRETSGTLFQRAWFEEVIQAPLRLRRVRFWDRAATKPDKKRPNPDWTRGVLLGIDDDEGIYYILDVRSCRDVPGAVKALIERTAEEDGDEVSVGLWQDPAGAGKFEIAEYVKLLAGYDVRPILQSKDKVTYARPVSAQAYAKNMRVVKGGWNRALYDEMEGFPDPKNWHDDQVDALSGAFVFLTDGEPSVADNWLAAGDNF